MSLEPGDPRHGTENGYTNLKCRCPHCRAVMSRAAEPRRRRRIAAMYERLGGACANCGSESNLEIDHVDPSAKEYDLKPRWGYALETIEAELAKAHLLCHGCHVAKWSVYLMPDGHAKAVRDTGRRPRDLDLTGARWIGWSIAGSGVLHFVSPWDGAESTHSLSEAVASDVG